MDSRGPGRTSMAPRERTVATRPPSSTSTPTTEEIELDLPALDGEDDALEVEPGIDPLDATEEDGDPFDDATQGEGLPYDEITVEGAEAGWLVDADTAQTLDVGGFDVVVRPDEGEGTSSRLLEEEEPTGFHGSEDLVGDDEHAPPDGGEEGPLDDDEELREEDLPALDADDDGDVADEELFDRGLLVADDELRWDDRAWAHVAAVETPALQSAEAIDDSGILAVPGEDPAHATRDATWKRLEETNRMMAAAFLPGGSAVVALASADRTRAQIVRIQPDGEASIIAEVEARAAAGAREDDGDACTVTFLRWDGTRGCLFVGGSFGVEAYRPAP